MKTALVTIKRFDPVEDEVARLQIYEVPWEKKGTVLSALLYIRERFDGSLAFRFGCRFRYCGLCAVEINGEPRLACLTHLKVEVTVGPLGKLPVLRDLVVDREAYFQALAAYNLFVPESGRQVQPETVKEPDARRRLAACVECLACLPTCAEYHFAEKNFGGPHMFVRLALQHFDTRDNEDRSAQALRLGIERCRGCRSCRCPNGIAIYRDAISPLLKSLERTWEMGYRRD